MRAPYGDFWSGTVPIAGTPPAVAGSAWGTPGRYVYRYTIDNPNVGPLDWIIDPCAREFGVGKLSAFTLGYQPYVVERERGATGARRRSSDLILYEIEHRGVRRRPRARRAISWPTSRTSASTRIEIMPLSNVGDSVDWGYLPIGYFGVDERFGNRSDFQQLVDVATSTASPSSSTWSTATPASTFPYYDAYTRLRYHENPFMGPFAKDYFSNFGKSTDFTRQLTRDYFFTVNHHWLDVYHVDGFRYDCVPNYWDGPLGVGYASLVYETYQLTKTKIAQGAPYWSRFDGGPGAPLALDSDAPSSSRTPRGAFCARPTRTAPGRTAPSTRRAASRAATAGGSPISACRSGCSATRTRRRQRRRRSRRRRCSTSRTTTTSASCATSASPIRTRPAIRCSTKATAAAGSCCSPTSSPC